MTSGKAAKILGIPGRTCRRYLANGALKGTQHPITGRWTVEEKDLAAFLALDKLQIGLSKKVRHTEVLPSVASARWMWRFDNAHGSPTWASAHSQYIVRKEPNALYAVRVDVQAPIALFKSLADALAFAQWKTVSEGFKKEGAKNADVKVARASLGEPVRYVPDLSHNDY